jgi:hypothetical protein
MILVAAKREDAELFGVVLIQAPLTQRESQNTLVLRRLFTIKVNLRYSSEIVLKKRQFYKKTTSPL